MSGLINDILFWATPPVVGAVIGYVTNDVAIRMLFRPLKEIKIFKIRLPFTPGIIPKQRFELANSIGNMVSDKLLTVDTVKQHLESESLKQSFLKNISSLSDTILNQNIAGIKKDKLTGFYNSLEEFLKSALQKLFLSENFHQLLCHSLNDIVRGISETKVSRITSAVDIKKILTAYILPFVTGPHMKTWISREIKNWIKSRMEKNVPLSEMIPAHLVDDILTFVKSVLPDFLDSLFLWLKTPDVRALFETQGRALLKNILEKLNGLQKFFISVAQYDKTLDEKIPDIIDDALDSFEKSLREPGTQDILIKSLRDGINQWEQKSLLKLIDGAPIDVNEKIDRFMDTLFNIIGDDAITNHLVSSIDDFIEKNNDKSVKEVLEQSLQLDTEKLRDSLNNYIIDYIKKESTIEFFSSKTVEIVIKLMDNLQTSTISSLFKLTPDTKAKIDLFILEKFYDIAEERLPGIIAGLNIKELVVNKINNLDILDVEKLLLMVISKHLKWINLFGAILGALIGIVQVFSSYFLQRP